MAVSFFVEVGKMTHGDQIRAMSNKELADFMGMMYRCPCFFCEGRVRDCPSPYCYRGCLDWLDSEVVIHGEVSKK